VVAATTLALSACGSSGGSSSDGSSKGDSKAGTKVRILSYPTSGSSWPAYIALKEGFFAKHGIQADLVSLPAGQQGSAALAGGSVDVGLLDTNNMGPLLAKGGKYTLMTNANTNYWILIGNKKLAGTTDLGTALKSLSGVSVPSLGGSAAQSIGVLQRAYDVPTSKLSLVADPSSASFTSGRVGAYMTDTLDSCEPLDEGYPKLMDFVDPPADKASYPPAVQSLIGLAGLGYWASNSFLKAHPQLASQFQAAISETITWAKDPANLSKVATLFRGTTWDFPKLNDTQWSQCAQRVINTMDDHYGDADITTWNSILKGEGIAALPPRASFVAPGVPQS
jgi:ABC-type nitrate/sulfonate/bicarbonate transport system substrate-binding protein